MKELTVGRIEFNLAAKDVLTPAFKDARIAVTEVQVELLKRENQALRHIIREALDGLDTYWQTTPEGVALLERMRAAAAGDSLGTGITRATLTSPDPE